MKPPLLWVFTLLVSLSVLLLNVIYVNAQKQYDPSEGDDEIVAELDVGGIRLGYRNESLPERNPFRYAPVRKPAESGKVDANAIGASDSHFPAMSLEGILLRRSEPAAFMHYRGDRKVVSEGEEIVSGVFLEKIDPDSIVIENRLGERRRLYLVD